jgi:antitoxin (DNA-binding transcriptional repressor) of toxin-antitoxin stability system
MEVITAREFRANQTKYFGKARLGEDVILKARGLGSFRLVPVTSEDSVTHKPDLTERIAMALREVKLMKEGKLKDLSMGGLLDEL